MPKLRSGPGSWPSVPIVTGVTFTLCELIVIVAQAGQDGRHVSYSSLVTATYYCYDALPQR